MKSEVDINWRRKNKHHTVGVAQFQTLNIWKLPKFNSASRLKKWCWEDVIFAVGVFTRITLLPYPGVTSKSEITKLENMFLFFFGFTRGWTISDEILILPQSIRYQLWREYDYGRKDREQLLVIVVPWNPLLSLARTYNTVVSNHVNYCDNVNIS